MEAKTKNKTEENVKVNPLHKEKLYIRFVPKKMSGVADSDKRHPIWGALADGATITLCAPVLRSTGKYKNVLTNDEKDAIEAALLLDNNALSVYKQPDCFWDTFNVKLTKEGLHLDLSDPDDYLKYAIIRANDDIVAPSIEELQDRPKLTYRFVIVREKEETNLENAKMDATIASYKEFAKIDNDYDKMRVLVELLDGRPYDVTNDANFFRSRINVLIQADPKRFLQEITDPLFPAKVLIRRGTELGKLTKRADYYYLKADNSPLCESGENPTLSVAARYINLPKHQDVKFILESEVNKAR
jgi:hypothetical protein